MSMDVKKEMNGNFYRPGKLYTQERLPVHDHDFRSLDTGVIVPHGFYHLYRNIGYVTQGVSHDTSEFACACIGNWWLDHGRHDYPQSTCILILGDCGGVTMPIIICSNKICSNWLMNWISRFALLTVHLTHPDTI
jgi:hypothetical protein